MKTKLRAGHWAWRLAGLAIACFTAVTALADTHYVSLNGLNQTPFTNWTMAATNFNNTALWSALSAGDVLMMTNGTYPMDFRWITYNITIKGAEGEARTILDGGAHDGFSAYTACTGRFERLTLSNFFGLAVNANVATFVFNNCVIEHNTGGSGTGIATAGGGSAYITNCVIRRNVGTGNTSASAVYHGGAVCVLDGCQISENTSTREWNNSAAVRAGTGGLTIRNSQIWGNSNAYTGGGIYISAAGCLVENCLITSNQTLIGTGGGAFIAAGSTIQNCLVAYNTANNGGGINNSGGILRNCTVVRNSGGNGGGINGSGTSVNSIVYFNTGAGSSSNFSSQVFSNSCTAPLPAGGNNITDNPMLVNLPFDCRLLKGSPCINTGLSQDWMSVAVDLDGRPRIREGRVDMGAYEYFPRGTILMIQ